jgi:hypothetical protein
LRPASSCSRSWPWTVDGSADGFVGYRVQETLAGSPAHRRRADDQRQRHITTDPTTLRSETMELDLTFTMS